MSTQPLQQTWNDSFIEAYTNLAAAIARAREEFYEISQKEKSIPPIMNTKLFWRNRPKPSPSSRLQRATIQVSQEAAQRTITTTLDKETKDYINHGVINALLKGKDASTLELKPSKIDEQEAYKAYCIQEFTPSVQKVMEVCPPALRRHMAETLEHINLDHFVKAYMQVLSPNRIETHSITHDPATKTNHLLRRELVPYRHLVDLLNRETAIWDAKYLHEQHREHSHDSTTFTRWTLSPLAWIKRGIKKAAKIESTSYEPTLDQIVSWGTLNYLTHHGKNNIPLIYENAVRLGSYFRDVQPADVKKNLHRLVEKFHISTPHTDQKEITWLMQQEDPSLFDPASLHLLLSTQELNTLSVQEKGQLEWMQKFFRDIGSVSVTHEALINNPLTGVQAKAPLDEKHVERHKEAAYNLVIDGRALFTEREINHRAGKLTYLPLWEIRHIGDTTIHNSGQQFERFLKQYGKNAPLSPAVRQGVASFANVVSSRAGQWLTERIEGDVKSYLPPNIPAAIIVEHWEILAFGFAKRVIRNVADTDKKGQTSIFLSELWDTVKHNTWGQFVWDMIKYDPDEVYMKRSGPIVADELQATTIGLTYAGMLNSGSRLQLDQWTAVNNKLSAASKTNSDNIRCKFVAGCLNYVGGARMEDSQKLNDAREHFLNVKMWIKKGKKSQLKDNDLSTYLFIEHNLLSAAGYYLARIDHDKSEGYHRQMHEAYESLTRRVEIVEEQSDKMDWAIKSIGKRALAQQPTLEHKLPELGVKVLTNPLNFSTRRAYLEALVKHNSPRVEKEFERAYDDLICLSDVLTENDKQEARGIVAFGDKHYPLDSEYRNKIFGIETKVIAAAAGTMQGSSKNSGPGYVLPLGVGEIQDQINGGSKWPLM
jgi:hypothetical protein